MQHSALINVMIAAARKAARALKRDFGEVENLQVSLKGPGNFVTAADRRAEETLRSRACQGPTGLRLSRRGKRQPRRHRHDPHLDRRSTRRHHQLSPRHPAVRHLDRVGALRHDRGRRDLQSDHRRAFRGRAWQGRVPQRQAAARGGAQASRRRRDRLRLAASGPRRSRRSDCANSAPSRTRSRGCAGSARRRSILPSSRLAGSTATGSATSRRGTWRPAYSGARSRRLRHRYRRRSDAMFTKKSHRCRQRDDPTRITDIAESRRLGRPASEPVLSRTVSAPFALNLQ